MEKKLKIYKISQTENNGSKPMEVMEIAVFMCWKYTQGGYKIPKCLTENTRHPGATIYTVEALLFHSSWEWLLPVVHKIAELEKQHMDCSYHFGKVLLLPITTPIEIVYAAVTEFLKWYNTQKTDNGNDNN